LLRLRAGKLKLSDATLHWWKVARRSAFLPENPYFYKFLIGEETLRFFGKLCRLHSPRLDQRVRELLELVSLTNARYQRLSTYSKGMLQRIDLAQALINQRSWLCSMNQPAGADLSVHVTFAI
jgi:ABC-2 type transport system ATP-binding protein